MKTHIAFCLDESGSVSGIKKSLIDSYNSTLQSIKSAILEEGQEGHITALAFGDQRLKHRVIYENQQVQTVKDLGYDDLRPSGMTPLFDSVKKAIEALKGWDDGAEDTAFVITVVTDGAENASTMIGQTLQLMREMTDTDRWTFSFLVPNHCKHAFLRKYGHVIPEGNVQGWDANTSRGTQAAFQTTSVAYGSYFQDRSKGIRSSRSFYADLSNVSESEIKAELKDISKEVSVYSVDRDAPIRPFAEQMRGHYESGTWFYQLTKTEKIVQPNKLIMIRNKDDGKVYVGNAARQLLGLDLYNNIRLKPGNFKNYEVFIQSTSVNRKLLAGTKAIYWKQQI